MIDPDYHHPLSTGPSLRFLTDQHPSSGDDGWDVVGLSGGTDDELMATLASCIEDHWSTWMDGFQEGKRTIVLYRKQIGDPQHDLDGPITDEWLMAVGFETDCTGGGDYGPVLKSGRLLTDTATIDGEYHHRYWHISDENDDAVYITLQQPLEPRSRSSVLALVQYIEDNQ